MYLFVYGTLKEGFCNHELLKDAAFICAAETKACFPMINTQEFFPYLIDDVGYGHHIKGEVYKIDAETLAMLDILEGYPQHYSRKDIQVVSMGIELTAVVYFFNEKIDYSEMKLLESFEED